jgi:hypothetical protein
VTFTRRPLRFDSLDDVVRDAETLLAKGYDKAGNWDLAQVCNHLADWLTYPVEGFPKAPLPIRVMLRVVRATMGRGMLEKYLRDGMPSGKPTMPQSVHPAGGDPVVAVGRLRAGVRPLKDHPPARVQLAHAAHHLSFLVPTNVGSAVRTV